MHRSLTLLTLVVAAATSACSYRSETVKAAPATTTVAVPAATATTYSTPEGTTTVTGPATATTTVYTR